MQPFVQSNNNNKKNPENYNSERSEEKKKQTNTRNNEWLDQCCDDCHLGRRKTDDNIFPPEKYEIIA